MPVTLPAGPLPVAVSDRPTGVPTARALGAIRNSSRLDYNNYCNNVVTLPPPQNKDGTNRRVRFMYAA
jgi:hypothetical protein